MNPSLDERGAPALPAGGAPAQDEPTYSAAQVQRWREEIAREAADTVAGALGAKWRWLTDRVAELAKKPPSQASGADFAQPLGAPAGWIAWCRELAATMSRWEVTVHKREQDARADCAESNRAFATPEGGWVALPVFLDAAEQLRLRDERILALRQQLLEARVSTTAADLRALLRFVETPADPEGSDTPVTIAPLAGCEGLYGWASAHPEDGAWPLDAAARQTAGRAGAAQSAPPHDTGG